MLDAQFSATTTVLTRRQAHPTGLCDVYRVQPIQLLTGSIAPGDTATKVAPSCLCSFASWSVTAPAVTMAPSHQRSRCAHTQGCRRQ